MATAMRKRPFQLVTDGDATAAFDKMPRAASVDVRSENGAHDEADASQQQQPSRARRARSRGADKAADKASPPLVRLLSALFEPVVDCCPVCLKHTPREDAVELAGCGHRYCRPCLKTYLERKIAEGIVFPVCFHRVERDAENGDREAATSGRGRACGVHVADAQIERLVAAAAWRTCAQLRSHNEFAAARECPHCFLPQVCVGPENPSCVCVDCRARFCFFHGKSHAGASCADFELAKAASDVRSRRVARPSGAPGIARA